jgi:hypothetical protein
MHNIYEKILKRFKGPMRYLINQNRRNEGLKKGNLIKVFWWEDYPNFGDELNRVIAHDFGCTPVRVEPKDADVVMIGSVLDLVPDSFKGAIIGSGFRSGGPKRTMSDAKIISVRGHLTAERLSVPIDLRVLGDPGLLVSRFAKRGIPAYEVGLVPHLSDRSSATFRKLKKRLGDKCLVIDPRQPAITVVNQIAQCGFIFSSSLHGLVTADALGIPSRWIHMSEKSIPAFKFHDYYSAFDETRTPIQIDGNESMQSLIGTAMPPPLRVEEVKTQLDKCVDGFMASFRGSRLPEK